jgi:glucose-1-phosphate adenylyltransferase
MLDFYVEVVPAQQRRGPEWFKGSADAIFQSLNIIVDEQPDHVCIFGGDHLYKMDVRQMVDFHLEREADLTMAAIPVPAEASRQFGVIEVDADWNLVGFQEKPERPRELPDRPGWVLASMGNYVFRTEQLVEELRRDAALGEASQHDFARNIIPALHEMGRRIVVYDFSQNEVPGMHERERGYWRDVGTIDSYFQANMDLVAVTPVFDLYNPRWPVLTWNRAAPPAKFVFADPDRMGMATNSLVSEGCILSGGAVHRAVLGPLVRVNSYARVEESILLEGADIGRHCRIRRAIIDKHVQVPPGTTIGYDPEADARRFAVVDGIVVIPKGYRFGG